MRIMVTASGIFVFFSSTENTVSPLLYTRLYPIGSIVSVTYLRTDTVWSRQSGERLPKARRIG